MWNSRDSWKKYQKLKVGSGGVGIVGGLGITEDLNSREGGGGGLLNCFFLSFSNHENYSIMNIGVYGKRKIKTKVTSKQNIEHFKMIDQRLFIRKFCNDSTMLLSSYWSIFIRRLVFSSSPRANFSSFQYLSFSFLLIFVRFVFI